MKKIHDIKAIMFDGDHMTLKIDGKKHTFNLKNVSHPLWRASEAQRKSFEISPSGYGIHWPLIDEDLSIDGLLSPHTQPVFAETAHR